jgi:hypothetical protein
MLLPFLVPFPLSFLQLLAPVSCMHVAVKPEGVRMVSSALRSV